MPLNNQGAQTFHCSLCALKKLAASPGAWPNPTIQRIVAMLPPRLLSNGLMSPPHFVSTPNVRIFYWGLTSQAAAWWSNSVCHPSIASPFEQRTFVRHIFFFLSYYKIISALTYPLRPPAWWTNKVCHFTWRTMFLANQLVPHLRGSSGRSLVVDGIIVFKMQPADIVANQSGSH